MNEILLPTARLYAARRQLDIAESLGSGKDGAVLVARGKHRTADVAIKVHRFTEAYLREKCVYERLGEARVSAILGFNVPELVGFDDQLKIIENDDRGQAVRLGFRRGLSRHSPGIFRRGLG